MTNGAASAAPPATTEQHKGKAIQVAPTTTPVIVPTGQAEGKAYTLKNVHLLVPEKDTKARRQLQHDLTRMGCADLMLAPWIVPGGNLVVMEVVGKLDVSQRWMKTPRGKVEEWMEEMIENTYALKRRLHPAESDQKVSDLFFTEGQKDASKNGYRLTTLRDNDANLTAVLRFLNPNPHS